MASAASPDGAQAAVQRSWTGWLWRAGAGLLLAVVLAGLLWFSRFTPTPQKVSGFIEADEIRVGSRVGGRVAEVAVEEGDRVQAGTLLVLLEPYDLNQQRSAAAADLAQLQHELEKLRRGYRAEEIAQAEARQRQLAAHRDKLVNGPREQELEAAQAELELAESNLELADVQLRRARKLAETNARTQSELDEAVNQRTVAAAALRVKRAHLSLLQAGTREEELQQAAAEVDEAEQAWLLLKRGYREEEVAAAEAAVDAALARLATIDQQLDELQIRAPSEAVVEAIELQPGDLVPANSPAVSLIDLDHLWVRAYVPEDELDLQLGQPVEISVDSYPARRFAGRLTFVARQGEFTPNNVQTPDERSKQVFRIKVTLGEGHELLRPGMAADVWLPTAETAP